MLAVFNFGKDKIDIEMEGREDLIISSNHPHNSNNEEEDCFPHSEKYKSEFSLNHSSQTDNFLNSEDSYNMLHTSDGQYSHDVYTVSQENLRGEEDLQEHLNYNTYNNAILEGTFSKEGVEQNDLETSDSASRSQKRSEVKKVIITFVQGITSPTHEAMQNIEYKRQKELPLSKALLYNLFVELVRVEPPLEMPNESVFWKHILGNIYNKHEIYKTKKKGGYKGISGVRLLDPNLTDEQEVIFHMFDKLKDKMKRNYEFLLDELRNISNAPKVNLNSNSLPMLPPPSSKKENCGKRKREEQDDPALDHLENHITPIVDNFDTSLEYPIGMMDVSDSKDNLNNSNNNLNSLNNSNNSNNNNYSVENIIRELSPDAIQLLKNPTIVALLKELTSKKQQ